MPSIRSLLFNSILIFGVLIPCQIRSQSFGGLPPGLNWSQIKTDSVRIIFPKKLESQAQRVSNIIHYLKAKQQEEIGDQAFPIDIILNNQSTVSNASVSLAPWKSEFITTPLQNSFELTAMPWLDLLAIHEYRHVIQLSTARRGIVKWLYYLFGQETWAGSVNLSIPNWFAEGDAVWAETMASGQGRGRIAAFLQGNRALKAAGRNYSYIKSRNGSLRDYVPDHYRLGYLMVKYGHEKFQSGTWKEVLRDASAYKGLFYPFNQAIKRRTGLRISEMYNRTMDELPLFKGAEENIHIFHPVEAPKTFTSYLNPHLIDDHTLLYYKRSFDEIGRFCLYDLNSNSEKILLTPGVGHDTYYGYNEGYFTWTEVRVDPRWQERSFSEIFIFNIQDQTSSRITRNGKYFSPQPNKDASKVVAVLQDENMTSALHILDVKTQSVTDQLEGQDWVFTYPKWTADGLNIVSAVRNSSGEMGLIMWNPQNSKTDTLVPFDKRILGIPFPTTDHVYFTMSAKVAEQIYRVAFQQKEVQLCSNEANGAFQPSIWKENLLYVSFTHMGYVIKQTDILIENAETSSDSQFDTAQNLLDSFPNRQYPVKPYRPWAHLINPHTWGLDFDDPHFIARVLSNNVLNNMELSAGVQYNYDNQIWRQFIQMQLAAWYPWFTIRASRVNRELTVNNRFLNWREIDLFAGISTDLNLMSNTYLRRLTPLMGFNRTILSGDLNGRLSSLVGQITFEQQQLKARKNIFTHSGQYLHLQYNTAVDTFAATQWLIQTAWATRGLFQNHNIILEADYRKEQEEGDYQFSGGLNHRGFGVIPASGNLRLSIDYHLPLVYPDWGYGGLFYIFRIRTNFFYEYTRAFFESNQFRNFHSIGTELVFDLNLVQEVPTSLGVRFSYPLESDLVPQWEVFLPLYRF